MHTGKQAFRFQRLLQLGKAVVLRHGIAVLPARSRPYGAGRCKSESSRRSDKKSPRLRTSASSEDNPAPATLSPAPPMLSPRLQHVLQCYTERRKQPRRSSAPVPPWSGLFRAVGGKIMFTKKKTIFLCCVGHCFGSTMRQLWIVDSISLGQRQRSILPRKRRDKRT